jgi:hypothetical protein
VVMSWIAGFLREFRQVCRRLFCGGLCTLFIRRAYLHTTSSVLVHRATVSVGPAICGYACVAPAVRACCLRFRVVCVVCVSACWISNVVCVVCVVRFPTLPTRRAMRTSCHACTNMHMCKVGWCACVAWHATHASNARIFFYRCLAACIRLGVTGIPSTVNTIYGHFLRL